MNENVFAVLQEGSYARVIRSLTDDGLWEEVCHCPHEWALRIAEALNRPPSDPIVDEVAALRAANLSLAETLVERDRELSAFRGGHV